MYSINIMVSEHDNIMKFNKVVRNACLEILQGMEPCPEDFHKMISFIRNYADKHHHGKEEHILFKEMQQHLGNIGTNLITHGMLVEHDLGRLYTSELEAAVNEYSKSKSLDSKLDIVTNAVGYTKLLERHIDKENKLVYTYAEKNLSQDILKDVDVRVEEFEKQADANNISKTYLTILDELSKKYK